MTTGQKAATESDDNRDFLPEMVMVYASDVAKLLGKKYMNHEVMCSMAEDLRNHVREFYTTEHEVHQPKMDQLRSSAEASSTLLLAMSSSVSVSPTFRKIALLHHEALEAAIKGSK